MMNQNAGDDGCVPPATLALPIIETIAMPAIRQFIDVSSGMNVVVSAQKIRKWGQRQQCCDHCADQDADPVAGDAMHGRAERLPPRRGDIGFVHPGQRFAAPEDIKESAERTGEQRHQHEAPFQATRCLNLA